MERFNSKIIGSRIALVIVLPLLIFLLPGCYTGNDVQNFRKNSHGEKMFSFYDYQDGVETSWKVYFKDDSISALYKNGSRVPQSEIENYSDMIYDKIEDIADLRRSDKDVRVFSFNHEYPGVGDKDFKIKIHKDIKDEMKKLSIEMEKMKDKDFHVFKGPAFKNEMKKFRKEIRKLPGDSSDTFVFHFDSKDLDDELENLTEELKNIEIEIDIPEIDIDLKDLDENMKDLDIELKDLDGDLKNLDKFFEELKSEMVKDKFIQSTEDDIKLRMEKDKMYINDKEVPADIYNKYKELYKKHTGKEFEGNQSYYFNND